MTVHRLVLVDRSARDGVPHRHRWAAECSCGGWVGRYRRRRREAVEQHRVHATAADRGERGIRTRTLGGYGPRAVTADADLPEGLR